jgi:hypothetical protein
VGEALMTQEVNYGTALPPHAFPQQGDADRNRPSEEFRLAVKRPMG